MATLVIKNLPDSLYARLKARALRNHRSLNKEAVTVIESTLSVESAGATTVTRNAFGAVFSAADELAQQGIDTKKWAANSRKVWR